MGIITRWPTFLALSFCFTASAQDWQKDGASYLDLARQAHARAESFEQWSHSPFHPEAIKQDLLQHMADPGFLNGFCQALTLWPDADLFYVAEFLEAAAPRLPCGMKERDRYLRFLMNRESQLAAAQTRAFVISGSKGRSFLGPSEEISLDFHTKPVVVNGDLPQKELVLTFDDGPHGIRTPQLLRLLEAENIQVQFFLIGTNVQMYPDIVREIAARGHEIGAHSVTHPDLSRLPLPEAIKEIENSFWAVQNVLSEPKTFFRFPYGAKNSGLKQYLTDTETPEFFWNIDTEDWKHKDPAVLLPYVLEQVRHEGRGLVLFHDIQPQTLSIMPAFLAFLKNEGYRLAVFRPATGRKFP